MITIVATTAGSYPEKEHNLTIFEFAPFHVRFPACCWLLSMRTRKPVHKWPILRPVTSKRNEVQIWRVIGCVPCLLLSPESVKRPGLVVLFVFKRVRCRHGLAERHLELGQVKCQIVSELPLPGFHSLSNRISMTCLSCGGIH